ncbi:hypothetical protein [Ornithinibacillus sp. 179-J 7C1 HS]|uniref:hypothetical protein n=1 Tax=Ornithinibacillus sp. 179-J 7C1 HS TaxID=3142384 RepID=UPI0039A09AFA
MNQLSHEEVIKQLNKLLSEDVTEVFEEQLREAGEHGNPSFTISGRNGMEIVVAVEWDKESDQLYFRIEP